MKRGTHAARRVGGLAVVVGMVGALGFAVAFPSPAIAVVPAQEWLTAVTGSINAVGQTQSLTFGTSGVTATVTSNARTGTCNASAGSSPLSGTNVDLFISPAPPPTSARVVMSCASLSSLDTTVTFNKPVISPILHVVNLDMSSLTIGGTSTTGDTIGISVISANDALAPSGNTLNPSPPGPINPGCEDNSGGNPNGACGSMYLTAASGFVQTFTLSNVNPLVGTGDGWAYSLSIPSAPVTPSFGPTSIVAGATSYLTFTIDNPGGTGSAALTPLDFTATLPSGLTIANATTSTNGNCGGPGFTDAGGGGLGAGDTGVMLTGISVAAGATCTMTVAVTSGTPGTYTVDAASITTGVGNLVPDGTTTLTVTATGPLANDDDVTSPGGLVTFDPLANDVPSAGNTLVPGSVRLLDGSTPVTSLTTSEGTYTVNTTTGAVTFVPAPGFSGPTTPVPYLVSDTGGGTGTGLITVTVAPVEGVSLVAWPLAVAAAILGAAGLLVTRRRTRLRGPRMTG